MTVLSTTGQCAVYIDVCTPSVLCYSTDGVPAFPCLSINKSNETFQLAVFCSFQSFRIRYVAFKCRMMHMWFLFRISIISIVSCVRPYLCAASRRWRPYYKWHNKYVLCTFVEFVQCRLVYKCFKRLHIRLLRIFWAVIMFSNEVKLLEIRRLFSWLHVTRFVSWAYQHEMTQKGPRSTNRRPILFLSKFFFYN